MHYHPLYGALQDLPPGQPDLDRFASTGYYKDCVHMTAAGRRVFIDAFEMFTPSL